MKKTEENVRLIAETILHTEGLPDVDVDAIVKGYLRGEPYEPTSEDEEEFIGIVEEALHNEFDRHKPTEKEAWEASAPKITVKVGDKEFQTYIDADGVQRFCGNSVITDIMHHQNRTHGEWSLNTLVMNYHNGQYSSEDWLDFMTSFGYSVSGLTGLTEFQRLPVENPLWDEPLVED